MNKRGIFAVAILFLLLVTFVIAAEENDTTITVDEDDDEYTKVNAAYACLEDKIDDRCDDISSEERIFALMATGQCEDEVVDDAKGDKKCWPESGCKIKTTAQAMIALNQVGTSTDNAEEWLFEQSGSPDNVEWLLQIESSDEVDCTISYGSSYSISIGEDKKINTGAGSCLSLYTGGYWLRVSPSCYDKEFEISCDKSFQTNLIYKKKTSSTLYISEKTNSASAEGTTTEKIESKCIMDGTTCDYEGTLWAALALPSENVSSYIPYLVTMADENEETLPESFLYLLTGYVDFKADLFAKQIGGYWDESGDKFFDTAVAMYPFRYEDPSEKQDAKDWLLEIQGKDGCWDGGNIRNNAFILASLWPDEELEDDEETDCEDSGYYCMSAIDCSGNTLGNYGCSGVFVCCDSPKQLESCNEQGGEICSSSEICKSGIEVDASDIGSGTCCVSGSCEEPMEESECEQNFGTCRSYDCGDDEEEVSYDCDNSGDNCCVEVLESGGNYTWIWILLVLIVLVVVGIIFRDKLRHFWFRIKSGFKKSGPGSGGPRRPGSGFSVGGPIPLGGRPPIQRRILPPQRGPAPRPRPKQQPKPSGELSDVLKKLKEMGK